MVRLCGLADAQYDPTVGLDASARLVRRGDAFAGADDARAEHRGLQLGSYVHDGSALRLLGQFVGAHEPYRRVLEQQRASGRLLVRP